MGDQTARRMVLFCPVGPHMYEMVCDPTLGYEELDCVKCAAHEDAEPEAGVA